MNDKLMTVEEVSEFLRIGRTKLFALIKDGKIAVVRIDGRTLFDPADVRAFVEARKTAPVTKPDPVEEPVLVQGKSSKPKVREAKVSPVEESAPVQPVPSPKGTRKQKESTPLSRLFHGTDEEKEKERRRLKRFMRTPRIKKS